MQFIQARNYHKGRIANIRLVVIHAMQAGESPTTAEGTARFFATTDKAVSAHYCCDDNSTVQCVKEEDTAWAAPGANADGIQIELAGFSEQTAAQWADAYSTDMLQGQAGPLVRDICQRRRLPVRFVGVDGLIRGDPGITTHVAVSEAFKKSTHWDPGPNFPMTRFLEMVRGEAEEDMPLSNEDLEKMKQAMRLVLNEGTARGQRTWADTSAATLATVQSNTNGLRALHGKVDSLVAGNTDPTLVADAVMTKLTAWLRRLLG